MFCNEGSRGLGRLQRSAAGVALASALSFLGQVDAQAHSLVKRGVDFTGTQLRVELGGQIPSRCSLEGGGAVNFGELRADLQAAYPLQMNCNVPFEFEVISLRRGLAHAVRPGGEGGFAGTLGYRVKVQLPTLSPQSGSLVAEFDSNRGTAYYSSGEGISIGNGRIEFVTLKPAGEGLLAGQYSDTLKLVLAPRI